MAVDFKEVTSLAHQTFRELALHELNLATGLQSLVPSNKEQPSKSAQYLHENAQMLKELSEQLKELLLHSALSSKKRPPDSI